MIDIVYIYIYTHIQRERETERERERCVNSWVREASRRRRASRCRPGGAPGGGSPRTCRSNRPRGRRRRLQCFYLLVNLFWKNFSECSEMFRNVRFLDTHTRCPPMGCDTHAMPGRDPFPCQGFAGLECRGLDLSISED